MPQIASKDRHFRQFAFQNGIKNDNRACVPEFFLSFLSSEKMLELANLGVSQNASPSKIQ
jgi:hypothetical protein